MIGRGPAARERSRRVLGAVTLGLAAVTGLCLVVEAPAATPLRHAYLVPVVGAALAFGAPGGALAALAAILLSAPLLLPEVERAKLSRDAVEGLVSFAVLLAAGVLAGRLRAHARRQRTRYETLLAVQRALADEAPLERALARLAALLAEQLAARAVMLAARDGERLMVSGGGAAAPGSVVDRVLTSGVSVYVADTGEGAWPRRVFATPLVARGDTVGVLALEREGDLSSDERAAVEALGAHVGLALENARLASRQRRFADELACRVAEATQAKSAFVAVTSHELRTPLAALVGFGELLATRTFPPSEVRRLAGIIAAEAARLGRIVSDLLDLARIERGQTPPLRRAPVQLPEALETAARLLRGAGAAQRIVIECAPGLPALDADADALQRILANLLGNAAKYSPPDGVIAVRARPLGVAGIVEVEVEDAGRGISPEARARIFEPYFRAPDAAAGVPGAGLGLAVVKSLVEAHGGRICIESAVGSGTRVALTLPAVP